MDLAVWLVVLLLMAVGLAGAVLPVLPGPTFIMAAVVLHKVYFPAIVTGWTVAAVAAFGVAAMVAEAGAAALGARLLGAGKWGIVGAVVGGCVGLFLGPVTAVLGVFAGATAAELLIAGRRPGHAAQAGVGAGLGFLAGTAAQVGLAAAMVLLFLLDCLVY